MQHIACVDRSFGSQPSQSVGPRRAVVPGCVARHLRCAAALSTLLFAVLPGCSSFFVNNIDLTDVLLSPTRAQVQTPADFGWEFENTEVLRSDGVAIRGYRILADRSAHHTPRGTVLFSSGASGNAGLALGWVRPFRDAGLDVVVYSYQGFGASDGEADIDTLADDAEAMFDFVLLDPPEITGPIALFGLSLGTQPTLYLASKNHPRVAAVVLESAFAPEDLVELVPEAKQFPAFLLRSLLEQWPAKLDSSFNVTLLRAPVLFIHSRDDEVVPIGTGERLFDAAPGEKEFLETFGLHTEARVLDAAYVDHLNLFLDRHVPWRIHRIEKVAGLNEP